MTPFLVLLDCDGTLVDSQSGILLAMRAAFDALGLMPPADQAVRRIVGLPVETAVATLAPDLDASTVAALSAGFRDAYAGLRRADTLREPLYPGVLAALDRLTAAGAVLGIATGKSRRGLIATLDHHDIRSRFDVLQTADDAPGKPAPDMALNAMAMLGFSAARTMMVGDTTFDIHMAIGARIAPVGVAWGYHDPDELRAAGAIAVLGDVAELPEIAGRLFAS